MKLALALALLPAARGSGAVIGGYTTGTDVSEHNRVDLDQGAINSKAPTAKAYEIYKNGANSKKSVKLYVLKTASPQAVSQGEKVCQGPGAGTITGGDTLADMTEARCGKAKYDHATFGANTPGTTDGVAFDNRIGVCADAGGTPRTCVTDCTLADNDCFELVVTYLPNDGAGTAASPYTFSGACGDDGTVTTDTGCFADKGAGTPDEENFCVGDSGFAACRISLEHGNKNPETTMRTIYKFSSEAEKKMGPATSTYPDALNEPLLILYKTYYGSYTYANDFVYSVKSTTSGCNQGTGSDGDVDNVCTVDFCERYFCQTTIAAGAPDPSDSNYHNFVTYDQVVTEVTARKEIMKKGSAFLSVWMYVVHELEDAIGDCQVSSIMDNEDPVHATDEAMAFYTGTAEGMTGFTGATLSDLSGYMIFALADKRCGNFGTCTGMPVVTAGSTMDGGSQVNANVAYHMQDVARYCTMLECEKARTSMNLVKAQMTVPLVQGLIRYAYKCSLASPTKKSMAEGAAFWASVAPQVDDCDGPGAARIQALMFRDMSSATAAGTQFPNGAADLDDIMTVLRACYPAMGITCADVGELHADNGAPLPAPAGVACIDPSTSSGSTTKTEEELPGWAMPAIIALAIVSVILLAMGVHARSQAAHFKEMYDTFSSGGGSAKGGGARRV